MVQAVLRGEADALREEAARLMEGAPAPAPRVITLSPPALDTDDVARYHAVIDNDRAAPLALVAVTSGEVARIATLLAQAKPLLAAADPALLDEIDSFGHEVVLATSGAPHGFGGAATVFLWGAVVLNPALVPNRIILIESLAHETAHALLFGLTLGADLTTNNPNERYRSPLRLDARPIEGIVHATFVLARMIYALERLAAQSAVTGNERAMMASRLALHRESYAAGLTVVEGHARFTEAGMAIFQACQQAM